jgi:predicted membrane channel-forming protein YqfA (hemolysin III family)
MKGQNGNIRLYQMEEVPLHFREPFILSGYRGVCDGSALQCIRATFLAPSNETFNVLTHLAAALWFAWAAGTWWSSNWQTFFEVRLEFHIYLVTLCLYPAVSAAAHVFSCASHWSRHVCFFLDYAALSLYALSVAAAFRIYAFPPALLGGWCALLYLPAAAVAAGLSLVGSCCSRFVKSKVAQKSIRFMSFATPCIFDVLPTTYGLLLDKNMFGPEFTALYFRMLLLTLLAAVFYCLHIPERFFPGSFDIVGHSHQLFHIFAALGSRDQMNIFLHRLDASLSFDCCPLQVTVISIGTIVVLTNIAVFVYFAHHLHQIIPAVADQEVVLGHDSSIYDNGRIHEKSDCHDKMN